jgi:4-hydroxybenzoate polyprenyltransferase
MFLVAQALVGLAVLVQFNRFAIMTGIASLLIVAIYPFMKRITYWPQVVLGLAFSWGALMGFAVILGRIDAAALVLYAGSISWVIAYDTIYAHQDTEDDALIGVKSTARLFGEMSSIWISGFYIFTFVFISLAGVSATKSWWAVALMLPAAAHLFWQVSRLQIHDVSLCLTLFRANRESGLLIALALAVASYG